MSTMSFNFLQFFLQESNETYEEFNLDQCLNEFYDKDTRSKIDSSYEYNDRFKFGLTFSHAINRITTANLFKHTLENTRTALAKTVADCSSPADIAFLRRDMTAGKLLMRKRIGKRFEQN